MLPLLCDVPGLLIMILVITINMWSDYQDVCSRSTVDGTSEFKFRSDHLIGKSAFWLDRIKKKGTEYENWKPKNITMMSVASKCVETCIRTKLQNRFAPKVLQIVNESYMHNVPKGSETHFKVVIVSDQFEGVPLIKVWSLLH